MAEAGDGPVPGDIRRMTVDPVVWHVGHVATFGFLAIVFVMTAKPAGSIAWLFPVVGAIVGVVLSQLQLRAAAVAIADDGAAVPPQRDMVELPRHADA